MRFYIFAFTALALVFGPEIILALKTHDSTENDLQKRDFDNFTIFNRIRNAHACIMSIVFIVLYPLGAISLHLPIEYVPFLKNTYLRQKVTAMHVPIQVLGTVMMVGAMGLGLRLGHDVGYLSHPVHAHVVIGLLVVCTILIFQPAMGILQHRHFKKTGGKSVFAYAHRWLGRGAIALGIVNNGLGFQLARTNVIVPTRSLVRNFVLMAFLVSIWFALVMFDTFQARRTKPAANGAEKGALDRTTASGEQGVVSDP